MANTALLKVSPTRMELTRLKRRLKTAARGHKLLKDKRDEMMRRFVALIGKNRELRERVERELSHALRAFALVRGVMSDEALEQALMYPARSVELEIGERNILSVACPRIEIRAQSEDWTLPYGLAATSGELDGAIRQLADVLTAMVELAEIEKTCSLLAGEIEKTRRRVNALEYVMIPQLTATIRAISMKLDENERGALTRLMKVKDMIAERGTN